MTSMTAVLADYWGWHHGDMGFGWWLVMFFINVAFWGAVIYGIVWLVRGGMHRTSYRGSTPGEILDRRLASGEISVEEYERLRERLGHGGPPTGGPPSTPTGGQPAPG
jgi:putative membrane protein